MPSDRRVAISTSVAASPPRVGSRIACKLRRARRATAAASSCSGAVSLRERRRRARAQRAATGWRRRDRRSSPRRGSRRPARTCARAELRRPRGTTPMPDVLMKSLSAAPRPTTLVSPVTIGDARARRGRAAPTRSRGADRPSGSPSSRMNASDSASGRAPPTARSLTVPLTASSPMSPPRKEDRRDDVGVGGEREPRAVARR